MRIELARVLRGGGLLISLAMLGLVGCQAGGGANGGRDKVGVEAVSLAGRSEATLVVQGLSCPLCAHNLDKLLLKVEGVQSAAVNMAAGTVAVGFDAAKPPLPQALAKAVTDAGFTLVAIQ